MKFHAKVLEFILLLQQFLDAVHQKFVLALSGVRVTCLRSYLSYRMMQPAQSSMLQKISISKLNIIKGKGDGNDWRYRIIILFKVTSWNNYRTMTEKISYKTVELDNTKITSLIHYRSGEMSDAARLLRKEEYFKRKLKSILDINGSLEKEIKSQEVEIRDERSGITFQLNDLIKELSGKFDCFVQEKLDRNRFKSNELSHETINEMMQKYERIEEECELIRKIYESLEAINGKYESHSKEMEDLVISLEVSNQQYEENMQNNLNDINEEIKRKMYENEMIENNTQELIKQIDEYVEGVKEFKERQGKMIAKIEKLKKMAMKQQEKVNEIKEWAEIVIDKNNRQVVYKTLNEKQEDLMKLKAKNDQLELYLLELQAQEKAIIKKNKENAHPPKSLRNTMKSKAKSGKNVHKA